MEAKKLTGQCYHGTNCRRFNCQFSHPEGFVPKKREYQFTTEQRITFVSTQEMVCNAMKKKCIKCINDPKITEMSDYFTDITIVPINKVLKKMGQFELNIRNFEKNGILNEKGRPHNVKSFFTLMWLSGLLIPETIKNEIHIVLHEDYKEIIAEKKINIQDGKEKHKARPVPVEESSSSEEEDEDEDEDA